MTNMQTGLAVFFAAFVLLVLILIIRDARTTSWRIGFAALAELVWEIIKSAGLAVIIFAMFAGVIWMIGFFVNSIWDLVKPYV